MALIDDIKSGLPRQTIITFPNNDHTNITSGIHSGTCKLKRALSDNSADLKFGGCIASQFECVLEGTDDLTGKRIQVKQIINENEVVLFTGDIATCTDESDRLSCKIVAYDDFYKFQNIEVIGWYNGLTFPISIDDFLTSLLNYIGLSVIPYNVPNNFNLEEKTVGDSLKFIDVIRAICEINGSFGYITPNGKFSMLNLETYSPEITAMSGFKVEKYDVKAIDKVNIKSTNNDVGGTYGSGDNVYEVVGNFLCYNKTTTQLNSIAQTLYSKIAGITYKPCEFELPISDVTMGFYSYRYNVTSPQGDSIYTYIFETEFSGIQLFNQICKCVGNETRGKVTSTTQQEMKIINNRMYEINKTVDGLTSTVSKTETDLVDMNMLGWVVPEELGINNYTDDNRVFHQLVDRVDASTLNWGLAVTSSNTFRTYDIKPKVYLFDGYEFIDDSRILSNATANQYLEDKQTTYSHSNTVDRIYLKDARYSNVNQLIEGLKGKYIYYKLDTEKQIQIDGNEVTTQLNSKIEQTAENINLKVSKDEVISTINQTAEQVKIQANKIALEGTVTANENVIINTDGTIEAKNGKFAGTINGGNMEIVTYEEPTNAQIVLVNKYPKEDTHGQTNTQINRFGVNSNGFSIGTKFVAGLSPDWQTYSEEEYEADDGNVIEFDTINGIRMYNVETLPTGKEYTMHAEINENGATFHNPLVADQITTKDGVDLANVGVVANETKSTVDGFDARISNVETSVGNKANKSWTKVGEATSTSTSSVNAVVTIPDEIFNKAYEYYVVVETTGGTATHQFYDFLVPYQFFGNGFIKGYYYDSTWRASIRIATDTTNKKVSVDNSFTRIYLGSTTINKALKLYVYYR